MHLVKSALTLSLAAVFCSTAYAENYEFIYDGTGSVGYFTNGENLGENDTAFVAATIENGAVGFIKVGDATTTATNYGSITVQGLSKEEGYTKYATGMIVQNGTVINEGKITVTADSSWNGEAAKAIGVDQQGTAINNGTIIATNASGMVLSSAADGQKITNGKTGVINVSGSWAYGISIHREKGSDNGASLTVNNEGTIIATDGAIGVIVDSTGDNGTFSNSGLIQSESTAISISASNFMLELSGDSHIEGNILLATDSTIHADKLNKQETIRINKAGTIDADGSDLIVKSSYPSSTLKVGTVDADASSSVNFSFDKLGSESKKLLEVENVTGDGSVGVEYTASVSDALAAGADKNDLFAGIKLGAEGEPDTVYVSNDGSAWGNSGYYTKDKETGAISEQLTGTNTLLSSATDLAITNALMWRSQLSNLTDRMGTLRTMPETAGAWARYNGGRLDGRGIQHDYNTVEVGFDKAISNNVMLGISFDYTKGDTDLDAGTSDNNTYTLGLYGSYFNESGCFLDAMLKVGRIDTDYDLNNGISEKGDYMLTGTIVGIETGHRWNIQNYFIEPQVQLTYSYLRPENYNTNLREVKFDDMKSLIARVGIMGGMKFAEDRGSAYVKASYNHDFLGDIEGNYSGVTAAGNAVRVNVDDELDDNWGEVSLGASYQVTDSVNTFVDVGTGFGGDIDQKWRVNLGARYVF